MLVTGAADSDGDDAEDYFEPSLFADAAPQWWPEDAPAAFVAANLWLLYLNLAGLSSSSPYPLPATHVVDRTG